MKLEKARSIIDGYARWWSDSVDIYQEGDAVRLVCPMLDRNNDHMSIYLADDPNTGGYILSDLGAVLGDLSASGCDVLDSESRIKKLEQTLGGFGILRQGAELYATAGEDDLFQRMNMLMQGMASVDDLFFTARDSVRQFFIEDVADWLDDRGIRYTQDVKFSGRSGFDVKFDFVIPKTRGKQPERWIKTIGNPSRNSVANALFGWDDVSVIRGDSKSYLFLNGTNGDVDQSLTRACVNYGVRPAVWPIADEGLIEELVA